MKPIKVKPFVSSVIEQVIDSTVYCDVLKSYAKEAISFMKYGGNVSITNVNSATIKKVEFTECEIIPFHRYDIECAVNETSSSMRLPSVRSFSKNKIDLELVKKILVHSFSPSECGSRPYPSGGALYPIEPLVFLFEERVQNFGESKSGCYHFRPITQKLQLIKPLHASYFFDDLLQGLVQSDNQPCFCIVYLSHIPKSIFKYRYRGYRHAAMEAGSMYQQAGLIAQQLGLRNTVWSSFSDYQLLHALDLDYGTYMPLTMQLFGYEDSL